MAKGKRIELSYREKMNQQLFLEIISALIFKKHTQLEPVILIDEFGSLDQETQTFIWKYNKNFKQIIVSALSQAHLCEYNFATNQNIHFLEIKNYEPS